MIWYNIVWYGMVPYILYQSHTIPYKSLVPYPRSQIPTAVTTMALVSLGVQEPMPGVRVDCYNTILGTINPQPANTILGAIIPQPANAPYWNICNYSKRHGWFSC